MNDRTTCPADACTFEDTVEEVATHVADSDDSKHSWETLGYDDHDDFCHRMHFDRAEQLETEAMEARDLGDFDIAIDTLEGAILHFQRAILFASDSDALERRCRETLKEIEDVEKAQRIQEIDDLVDRAENALDAGDELRYDGDHSAAAPEYEKAIDAFEEATTLAATSAPDRASRLEHKIQRTRIRLDGLDDTGRYRSIRSLIVSAREHTSTGDRAFGRSNYGVALEEYKTAKERYEDLVTALQEFAFDTPVDDPNVCDVCRRRFDDELKGWEIELDNTLEVCPSCNEFAPSGQLPTPRDVETELRYLEENIESLEEGDVGVDWVSGTTASSEPGTDGSESSFDRDEREMLLQLIGLYQRLGRVPAPSELDEHTDFGYIAYVREFDSLPDALRKAGFEVE